MKKRYIASIGLAAIVALTASSCTPQSDQRAAAQKASAPTGESLEIKNLKLKRQKEENPDATRYLYLYSYGQPIGYYVTKGKISSNGSQIGPETEVLRDLSGYPVVDSAQDDGSYGAGDPGIFFFTSDGVMVVTSFDYLQSDQPLSLNVPRLYK